ncbi:MAG: hypothetical protein COU69_00320 [Candidatus Pacebacteria bacterium CG10_big_fil_rev_8_21_14_0_10_56_10]|nr:MAG: hypothetical protein COU69_00320 [Candidatus Pacebacteria bacterium CG10_big_fil_rev_8_21_14_0_10_56_10]
MVPFSAVRFWLVGSVVVGLLIGWQAAVTGLAEASRVNNLIGVISVRAQSPRNSGPGSTSTVLRKEGLADEIAQLRQTYGGQLAEYRAAYNDYQVSRAELQQLNTLKSLEKAVQSTKEAMRLRDMVLKTYLTLVRLELIDTFGVTAEYRQLAVDNIDATIAQLDNHQFEAEQIGNRAEVVALADRFGPIGTAADQNAAYAKILLKLGRLQNVFELAESLNERIQATDITDLPQLTQNERLRAYDQTNLEFSRVEVKLRETTAGLAPDDGRNRLQTDLNRRLSEVFAELSRLVALLDELAGEVSDG